MFLSLGAELSYIYLATTHRYHQDAEHQKQDQLCYMGYPLVHYS